jgi:hypothetical protein
MCADRDDGIALAPRCLVILGATTTLQAAKQLPLLKEFTFCLFAFLEPA